MPDSIRQNFQQVMERIHNAALQRGRDPEDVMLIVVTKGQSLEKVEAVLAAGAERLGENYVEEAMSKIQDVQTVSQPEWHMIGHIQSRKARAVCEYFDWIHSLDSVKLGKRLNHFASQAMRRLPVLLEFNVSGEGTKSGFEAWDKTKWPELLADIEAILGFQNILVSGIMVIPPFDPDPEAARPFFRCARELRDFLSEKTSQGIWLELSMGMSNDFEVAIQEGATYVRIGQAILGER